MVALTVKPTRAITVNARVRPSTRTYVHRIACRVDGFPTRSRCTEKTDIVDIDAGRILTKVAALPISEWSYSAEGTGVRHLGPMAQDFYAAFGLGEDDRHIATVGVCPVVTAVRHAF